MSHWRSMGEIQRWIGSQGVPNTKGQDRKYKNATDYEKMPYKSVFLTEDETRLEAPNPLTLNYQRDINLRLKILYSFARPFVDHQRASSSYHWIWQTRLAMEDGCPTCIVHVSVTKVYDHAAAQWRTCCWVQVPTDSFRISSASSGHVSEPHSWTECIVTEYTQPYGDKLMSLDGKCWYALLKVCKKNETSVKRFFSPHYK